MASPTPEEVLKFSAPTQGFLCGMDANKYDIQFTSFTVRDCDSKKIYHQVKADPNARIPADIDPDLARTITYHFPSAFLLLKNVGTTLVFSVGSEPVKNFRMIERHYFGGRLVKSYDFTFPFCIPKSSNEWDAVYEMPTLSKQEMDEILDSDEPTYSDSFYFVDSKLIMHNKAKYYYLRDFSSSTSPPSAASVAASVKHANDRVSSAHHEEEEESDESSGSCPFSAMLKAAAAAAPNATIPPSSSSGGCPFRGVRDEQKTSDSPKCPVSHKK